MLSLPKHRSPPSSFTRPFDKLRVRWGGNSGCDGVVAQISRWLSSACAEPAEVSKPLSSFTGPFDKLRVRWGGNLGCDEGVAQISRWLSSACAEPAEVSKPPSKFTRPIPLYSTALLRLRGISLLKSSAINASFFFLFHP